MRPVRPIQFSRQSAYGRSIVDWPTGVTVYDPEKCFNGYTLFCPGIGSPLIYLMDMVGEIVHLWFVKESETSYHAKYLGNGHILYASNWLTEVDWTGNVVWHYRPEKAEAELHGGVETVAWDPKYRGLGAHHDFQRLENRNTLILASEIVHEPRISPHELVDNCFIEVTPKSQQVWVWRSREHFDEFGFSDETKRLIREKPGIGASSSKKNVFWVPGDYLHTNTVEILPDTPLGKEDNRFRKGNILSSQRNTNTIYIIDRNTSEVVWHWGPGEIIGQHYPNMLPNGNILIYDNGGLAGYPREFRPYTRLVELDPVSEKIVWEYLHGSRASYFGAHSKFFSVGWGSVQRLPNGNTLSLDAYRGRLFEITPEGEIVWEYVNPYRGQLQLHGRICLESGVYRCYRIPYDEVPDFSKDFALRY